MRHRPGGPHGTAERLLFLLLTVAILLVLLLPILVVFVMSFTSATTLEFPPPGLTLRWYEATWDMLFGPSADFVRLRESMGTSLLIAFWTVVICVVSGVPAAYALSRIRFRGRQSVNELLSVPIVFPTIVLGVILLIIVSELDLNLGIFQVVIAHAIITLPFMIRNCVASLDGLDPALEEAAQTLGATPARTFLEVILPLMMPGIVSGVILVGILSINEFTLTYFLYTIDFFPLSMWLFQQGNNALEPSVFAVSTIVIAVNVVVILLLDRVLGRRGMRV